MLEYKNVSEDRLYEVLLVFEVLKCGVRLKHLARSQILEEPD